MEELGQIPQVVPIFSVPDHVASHLVIPVATGTIFSQHKTDPGIKGHLEMFYGADELQENTSQEQHGNWWFCWSWAGRLRTFPIPPLKEQHRVI